MNAAVKTGLPDAHGLRCVECEAVHEHTVDK